MATIGPHKGATNYPCPMCTTPVPSYAMRCPTCGTDLTRAGAVFTSSGRPVEWHRKRTHPALWIGLGVVGAVGLLLAAAAGPAGIKRFTTPGLSVLTAAARTAVQLVQGRPQRSAVAPAARQERTPARPATKSPSQVPAKTATAVPKRSTASAAAALTVSSTPRGARVQVDGTARGVTPLTMSNLRAGRHQVRVAYQGYRPVTRTVALRPGKTAVVGIALTRQVLAAPAAALQTSAAPPPERPGSLLTVGQRAPEFVAKDRMGLIYRSTDFRGRKLRLVFVQRLDGDAQRIIRELNASRAGGAPAVVAVVMHPDRTAIRQFTQSAQIQIPVLFGTPAMARAYGVGGQHTVIYLVSEDGRVMRRQVGRADLGSAWYQGPARNVRR